MSAERFFDDLARTLAEPMPRRRAVRVIGASLAAIAVPGISPQMARAATRSLSQRPVCPSSEICCTETDANGKVLQHNRCGFPRPRYQCVNYKCFDTCPPTNPALKVKQQATWSTEKYSDGTPKRYNCCQVPDTLPRNGECWPNCKKVLGPKAIQCGMYCCPPGHRCKGKGQCIPCPRGQEGCGSTCCKPGKQCTECKEKTPPHDDDARLEPNGIEKCCAPDEKCCGSTCCKKSGTQCCGNMCCDTLRREELCAYARGRTMCCPLDRTLFDSGNRKFCCPPGTEKTRGNKGCCPPSDPGCCPPRDGAGNALNCATLAKICVKGACVNP